MTVVTHPDERLPRNAGLERRILLRLFLRGTECISQLSADLQIPGAELKSSLEALERVGRVERRRNECPDDDPQEPMSRWGIRIPFWPFWRERPRS